jgi:hypothetical protein
VENINVRGLPEPVARALENMVDALRRQTAAQPPARQQQQTSPNGTLQLDHRPGKVIGRLTREELYDDAG